jgi:uncharacterized protein (DUF488 family)
MPQTNRLKLPSVSVKQQMDFKMAWNEARSVDGADFFTIGYTGRSTEELLNALLSHRVGTLVDIRQNAVSMYRPELSKSNLKRLLESRGISYQHLPQLGVPRDIRAKAIETGTRDVIWEWYDQCVVGSYLGRNLHTFLNSAEHPVAFMCTEVAPQECHRHRLGLALEAMGLKGFDL